MIGGLLRNRFLRNTAVLQVGGGLNAVLGIVSAVGLAHVLGARDQGSWVVAQQLYALLFFVVNLGVAQVAVTHVAAASARGLDGKVTDWLAFLVKAMGLIGLWMAGVGWFVIPWGVEVWRGINPSIDPDVGMWAWLLTLSPLLELPRAVAMTAFQGTRRMLAMAQTENCAELLRVFLVLGGAVIAASPFGAVVGQLLASGLSSLVAMEMYRRERRGHRIEGPAGPAGPAGTAGTGGDQGYFLPGIGAVLRRLGSVPVRGGLVDGLKMGVMRQTDALSIKILPPLLIQTFGQSTWVAYFRIAQSIMNVPLMLMQGVSRTALPALSELRGAQDDREFKRLFLRATFLGGGLVALAILAALPVVHFVVVVWPADYHGPIRTLSWILALGQLPLAFMIAMDPFYLLSGRLKAAVKINIAGFLVVVPLAAGLVYLDPERGAAWGFVVTTAVAYVHFVYVWRYYRGGHDQVQAA